MVEDTMFSGESKNIEYKVSLPDKSEKYMKTIVAFANTQGGKLIVGVDDKTHQIVGVENDVLFQLMDGIANAVSDSCVPQIIPDIEPQTVDGKTVIVVSVEAGKNRPYYLKSKGKDNGTYIRVAGTSRQAFPEKIKELEMEGARISWDELTCVGYPVSEEATEKLCQDIEKFRKKAGMSEHSVKKEQLINWKILKQSEGQLLATNAYALLTSDYFSFSKTQCAVFKGTDRAMFLDKREFTGPIYTQIEEAVDFVLRNIRLGATIDGLVRKEKYELPPEAIREMIINAHCHRNLLDESCIQVAVYDDRLEVTSPGGLYNGLTYEEVMNGHSKIRNKGIANIFSQMGLVEAWGSGIKRILNAAEEYGLSKPRFQEFRDEFEADIKKSRVSPRESLLFTYSFLKKENGCLLKIISETSGIIHVSKDICERIRSYIKRMKLGKRGEELQALVDSGGDLFIDFDGDAAYANKEVVFLKPAGAWIHFAIDYLRALNAENYEDLFYATIKEKDVDELEKGRFWIFVYEMEFDGFFDARSYEYIICQEDASKLYVLDDTQKKQLLQNVRVSKKPDSVVLDFFDEVRMKVEDLAEDRKEEIAKDAISGNAIKIGSRIEALRNLSNYRVRKLEDELIGVVGKDEERIRRAINREREKTNEKIRILEEKLNYVGTYALDAICLLDVV